MRIHCAEFCVRGLILFITLLFSSQIFANIQQRISIYTQQVELFRQICFLPDGTFLRDRVLFDVRGSITETAMDCNAQALALDDDRIEIESFVESNQCPVDARVDDAGLVGLLNGSSPIVDELSCPGIGGAEDCAQGLACNLLSSIIPTGVAAARFAFGESPLLNSCSGTGSCLSNIGKAIWDNLWDTVKGLYNLAGMGLSWVGDQLGSLWRAEDATSTRGIAATEISDSQLDQFLAHPIDYIYNMGARFIQMIGEGISSRYGCAEWSGVPHVSECISPMSWECANCNEKLNIICGVTGYIGANFITNFFTGGAVAAVQITSKIAASAVFTVARNIPGAARISRLMSTAGRVGRLGAVTGTIRAAWTAVKTSRTVQGAASVARQLRAAGAAVNGFARKRIFLYAQGSDLVIAAARGYNRLTSGAFRLGYQKTKIAADRARDYLRSQYPLLSDINGGRYTGVANPQQYLTVATRTMSAEERGHMRISITTGPANERRVVIYDNRAGTVADDISFNFNPRTPPLQVARPAVRITPPPVAAAENTVEEIVVTARRRPPTRDEYVESWSGQVATTPRENATYIDDVLRGEQPGIFYLDTQNTALKRLNDTIRNKALVDSFGNRYNSMVMDALEEFKLAHPGVTVNLYSDYKSLRASIRGPPGQEEVLMGELAVLMRSTEERFLGELRAANLVDETAINERWFRAGLGRTSDEANLVTRFSRRETDVTPTLFSSGTTNARIRNAWELTEQSRAQLATRFQGSDLLRNVEGTTRQIPSAEVLEVVRKSSTPQEIATTLSGRFGREVTVQDAELLREYFNRVDQFSPGLLIPSRVEHRFNTATNGGFSIDFAGVGSVNAEATAAGLARGRNLQESISGVRRNEIAVTRDLDALKLRTENAVRDTLSRNGITAEITVSGDDMVVIPNRALTQEIRRQIAEAQVAAQVGTNTLPSGMRTSFFREGIPDQASRSIQATIGESIEKKLRRRLEGQIPRGDLQQTLFSVDMRGTAPGTGGVGLDVVNPNLNPASRRIIDRELQNAIEDVNTELRTSGQAGSLGISSSLNHFREHAWISSLSTGSLSSGTSL